jgi:hypothetical protein
MTLRYGDRSIAVNERLKARHFGKHRTQRRQNVKGPELLSSSRDSPVDFSATSDLSELHFRPQLRTQEQAIEKAQLLRTARSDRSTGTATPPNPHTHTIG